MNEEKTILIADDDTGHRTMLRKLLSGWGYAIVEADDGATARDGAGREPESGRRKSVP